MGPKVNCYSVLIAVRPCEMGVAATLVSRAQVRESLISVPVPAIAPSNVGWTVPDDSERLTMFRGYDVNLHFSTHQSHIICETMAELP